jgi:hypothetical protein
MNVRERVLCTLTWNEPDRVPLTVYDWMLPRGTTERLLRENGIGLVTRLPAHRVEHRQVEFTSREYWEDGRKLVRRTIHTPVGDVSQTLEPEGAYDTSNWIHSHFIKEPADYKVMEFVWRDAIFHDNSELIREATRRMGDDGIVLVRLAKAPVQEMLYQMMGMERFGLDYRFQRELFDSLHSTMLERYEELYDLAASAPVDIIQLGDNITSDVVGDDRFRNYLMPVYKRLHDRLSGTGKLLVVHMDGRLRSLKKLIGEAEFDVVEAMTPPPMGDFSIAEAREAWAGKALWINYTSSMLIESPEVVEEHTLQLLEEAGTKRGFAISITEDAPIQDLERSLGVIARVLASY